MRWPSSLFQGLNSRPGSSFPSLAHFTVRGISLSRLGALYNPRCSGRRAPGHQQAVRVSLALLPGAGKCYRFRLLAASFDADMLALLNRPGIRWLDAVMAAASNRGLLLAGAALAAIYLWVK